MRTGASTHDFSHTQTQARAHTRYVHIYTNEKHARTHSRTYARARTHPHKREQARMYEHTHAHTHTAPRSVGNSYCRQYSPQALGQSASLFSSHCRGTFCRIIQLPLVVLVGIIDYENNVRMCQSISKTQVEDFVNEFAGENVRRKSRNFRISHLALRTQNAALTQARYS